MIKFYVKKKWKYFLGFLLIIFSFFFIFLKISESNSSVSVTASVNPWCGDNILEFGEQCDGFDLGGQTCLGLGYGGGILACNSSCIFDTSGCTPPPQPPLPPSGGGGGYFQSETKIIFSGKAYPGSEVTLLKDAEIIATTLADNNSNFNITLSGISGGSYIFSLYSEDKEGKRSSLVTFPVNIANGTTVNISGIFISPTIAVDKLEVKKGDIITIFGQSTKNADIIIQVSSENEFFLKTKSDENGVYLYNFQTTDLEYGDHFVKSRASLNDKFSPFSKAISFKVGTKNILIKKPSKCPQKADLNNDCRVNLVDFSIAAYWYKRQLSESFKLIEKQKLNGDGKINLIDFSIMAYYWTG
ncbi:MAG: hypothetical protein N2Z85_03005 [Patescibacteria group bacterium]|nr:hypothetical protein [Patescibacteria group bacterium]